MRRLVLVFLLLVPAVVAGEAVQTSAVPVAATVEGLSTFHSIAVGPRHIYLSPGITGSRIAVMNRDGTQRGSIRNIPGASGMVVVGDVLYVASFGASRIERFDLTTEPPTRLTPFSTAPLPSPRDLVFAGGRLWFSSMCDQWGSRVGWMPLNDGDPVRELKGQNGQWNYCTAIEAGPGAPDRIFLHNSGVSPQDLYEYDVTRGRRPELVVASPWDWGSYDGAPVVPLPGGEEFATAWTGGIGTFRMSDMFGPTFTYTGQSGSAVAASSANGGILGATRSGPYARELFIWRLGDTDPIVSRNFRGEMTEMWADGLAFSADGRRAYAVSGAYDNAVVFRVIRVPAP